MDKSEINVLKTLKANCPKYFPEHQALDYAISFLENYENRLKADLKAILVELQLEIHELENPYPHDYDNILPLAQHNAFYDAKSEIEDLVEDKISELKGEHNHNGKT